MVLNGIRPVGQRLIQSELVAKGWHRPERIVPAKRFGRHLFPDEFEHLLKMIYDGIRTALNHPRHVDGFTRLDAAYQRVGGLSLTDSKLHARMLGGDRPGTCHHLVNDGRMKWVK